MLKTKDLGPCLAVFMSALRPKAEGSSPKKLRRDSKQAPGSFDSFFALRKAIAFATPLKMGLAQEDLGLARVGDSAELAMRRKLAAVLSRPMYLLKAEYQRVYSITRL